MADIRRWPSPFRPERAGTIHGPVPTDPVLIQHARDFKRSYTAQHEYLNSEEVLRDLSTRQVSEHTAMTPVSTYNCITQPKQSPAAVVIGWNGRIDIWSPQATVNYVVNRSGLSVEQAGMMGWQFALAHSAWNAAGVGVTFNLVSNPDDAAFEVVFGGHSDIASAMAFFPNTDVLSRILVYDNWFTADETFRNKVALHELGHTLGLRHEFAPETEQGTGAVVFGPRDEFSIMTYNFDRNFLSNNDVCGTKALYATPAGTFLGGLAVNRIVPDN
jgi:Pregnancy-associated plasma protein-A